MEIIKAREIKEGDLIVPILKDGTKYEFPLHVVKAWCDWSVGTPGISIDTQDMGVFTLDKNLEVELIYRSDP
jgi:hypothetical protein